MKAPAASAAGLAVALAAAATVGAVAVESPQPSLDAARERRSKVAREELNPAADPVALAAEAQACAADAHRAWSAQFPDAAAARDRGKALSLIGATGAEALYLEAVCTEAWARMQGFTPLIDHRDEIVGALARVGQLAPDLDGAGAQRELGAVYAALPAYAGGDLELARKHLMSALERAPQDARNHIVLARTVAVKAQDRELFREQLRIAARSADPLAAAQAEALLARETDLFGPAEAAQPIPGGPLK